MAALTGIRVLDLTRLLPGPYGTMILADQGADVIKIEEPVSGDPLRNMHGELDGVGGLFDIVNRGKRSVTLNLRGEAGRGLFHKLLEQADVLVEGFRPGVMQRLGLDYASLVERHPKLIYCSISGFGQTGPRALLPGHDLTYLGWTGLLATFDGGAAMPPTLLADLQAGLCAAFGIVLALQERVATRNGRFVDVDMTRSLTPFLLPSFGVTNPEGRDSRGADMSGVHSAEADHREHRCRAPWFCGGLACYNVYRTGDGKLITLAALEAKFWRAFCTVVGRPDLMDDHLQPQRQTMLHQEVTTIIAAHPERHWLDVAEHHDVCLGPVRTQAESLADDTLRDPSWPSPFPTSTTNLPAPKLGADNWQVLVEELGCDPDDVARAQDA